jgi:hypothetical protein
MRLAPALLALAVAACGSSTDARRAGQLRYGEHTLEEWWTLRRDPSDVRVREAQAAIRMMGPAAVPFLADKAASRDLGDNLGGSVALEDLCPNALPAMEAARERYPSPALEVAIRRVRSEAQARTRAGICAANGDPVRPEGAP